MTQPTVSSQSVTAGGLKSEHYPSLELCKRLTEIGFPNTEMYIGEYKHSQLNKEFEVTIRDNCYEGDYETFTNVGFCPSVMEMLDVIPYKISDGFEKHYLYMGKKYAGYERTRDGEVLNLCEFFQELPNALAEMVLWLHENNYISFK